MFGHDSYQIYWSMPLNSHEVLTKFFWKFYSIFKVPFPENGISINCLRPDIFFFGNAWNWYRYPIFKILFSAPGNGIWITDWLQLDFFKNPRNAHCYSIFKVPFSIQYNGLSFINHLWSKFFENPHNGHRYFMFKIPFPSRLMEYHLLTRLDKLSLKSLEIGITALHLRSPFLSRVTELRIHNIIHQSS